MTQLTGLGWPVGTDNLLLFQTVVGRKADTLVYRPPT